MIPRTLVLLLLLIAPLAMVNASLLSPTEASVNSFTSATLNGSYDELAVSFRLNGNTSRYVGGNKVIVPWFGGDNVCGVSNLQNGSNCNIGTVTFTNGYCMVTDEHSVDFLIDSMGANQTRFNHQVNTLLAINSSRGQIPAWKVLVNETAGTLTACDSRTNSNCDTASDATARYIIGLRTAANNTLFSNNTEKAMYLALARNLTRDMLTYEINNVCYNSSLGSGPVCYWLAGGSDVKASGLGSTNYAYSGYYADAAIAFLMGCVQDNNLTLCSVAGNITLNYLQASVFNGTSFTVSPGLAFKWLNITGGNSTPVANCTNTCSPTQWDSVDAPRAHALGMLQYYAQATNKSAYFPLLSSYMALWNTKTLGNDLNSLPIQFFPNGTASAANQSGYKAQGLQAEGLMNQTVANLNTSLRNALDHYSNSSGTWDSAACFGIYGQSFSMRTLGVAIGRDENSWFIMGSGGGGSGSGLNFTATLNGPTNNSILNVSNTTLNVTVSTTNYSLLTNATLGTLPQIIYNSTFAATPASDGWTMNSWTWSNAGLINNTANDGGAAWSQNLSLKFLTNGYNITLNMSVSNFTNAKIFFGTNDGTQSGDRVLLERSGNNVNVKHDGGSFGSFTVAMKQYVIMNIYVNLTNNTVRVSSGASSWTEALANNHLTVNGSYLAFVPGQNMTGNQNSTGWNISDINVTNVGTAYNASVTNTVAPVNLNVTYYWANGTTISTRLNVQNNTAAPINVTDLADGNYTWYVNVTNGLQSQTFGPYNFEIDAVQPPPPSPLETFCTNLEGAYTSFMGFTPIFGILIGVMLIMTIVTGIYMASKGQLNDMASSIPPVVIVTVVGGVVLAGLIMITTIIMIGDVCALL